MAALQRTTFRFPAVRLFLETSTCLFSSTKQSPRFFSLFYSLKKIKNNWRHSLLMLKGTLSPFLHPPAGQIWTLKTKTAFQTSQLKYNVLDGGSTHSRHAHRNEASLDEDPNLHKNFMEKRAIHQTSCPHLRIKNPNQLSVLRWFHKGHFEVVFPFFSCRFWVGQAVFWGFLFLGWIRIFVLGFFGRLFTTGLKWRHLSHLTVYCWSGGSFWLSFRLEKGEKRSLNSLKLSTSGYSALFLLQLYMW